jgi:hypothetical protein
MPDRVVYFVVGDAKLNSGDGIYVKDLEEMKGRLLKMTLEGEWRLVISMHGAQEVIATKGGYLKDPDAKGAYRADDIRKLFGDDEAFKKWREKNGPTWTTLNSCQVVKSFETVILNSFNKPKAGQNAHGLGEGCRPHTEVRYYEYAFPGQRLKPIKTREQWKKLPENAQREMREMLAELNQSFGYFGGPPIDTSLILDYYFDEEPKGGWPVVTVSVNRQDTGWSFYNRTSNTRFLTTCKEHRGPMRPHTPTVPNAP